MSDFRSDFALVRHISRSYGPLVGRAWQDLPLIQVPPLRAVQLAFGDAATWDYRHRPFEDFVLDFGPMLNNRTPEVSGLLAAAHQAHPERIRAVPLQALHPKRQEMVQGDIGIGTLWVRVTSGPRFLRTIRSHAPWWALNGPPAEALRRAGAPDLSLALDHVVLTQWVRWPDPHKTHPVGLHDGFLITPETCLLFPDWPQKVKALFFEEERKNLRLLSQHDGYNWLGGAIEDAEQHALVAAGCIDYLAHCPEYLVEERPQTAAPRPAPKQDKKPWAFRSLPRIILLDPERAPTNPSANGHAAGGTHASPRPHQRRGHWRVFHHPMYKDKVGTRTFVKPAWIGPREWVLQGSVYRVLNADNA